MNEGTGQIQLQVNKIGTSIGRNAGFPFGVNGSHFHHNILDISHSTVTFGFPSFTPTGKLLIISLEDPTPGGPGENNWIDISLGSDMTKPFLRIEPGEACLIQPHPGCGGFVMQATTRDTKIEYVEIER